MRRVTKPMNSAGRTTIQNPKSKIQNSPSDAALAKKVALSCQILAKLGLFKETTGHVSARSSDGKRMLIRGRGREERGLLFTTAKDVVLSDFDGHRISKGGILKPPNESCIHGELYKAHPHLGAVVHAHPAAIVLTSMAGIELRPIFGGYDPRAMRLAIRGIPVYRSSLTLHSKEQVHDMMKVMGKSDVCVLRGHGAVVCGKDVEEATITAIKLDHLARLNLQAASLEKVPAISDEDQETFMTRRGGRMGGGGAETLWRFYCEWLRRA
jgi:ribulose-5-phosphate 4-epimerase/fuculose-1-phosphate aldolase